MKQPQPKSKAKSPIPYGHGTVRPTAYGTYTADVTLPAGRRRATFKTLAEAKAYIDAVSATDAQPLTAAQMREASEAFALLPPGVSLLDALRQGLGALTAPDADAAPYIDAYIAEASERLRPDTVAYYRRTLANATAPSSPLRGSLRNHTRANIIAHLGSICKPAQKRHTLRSLSAFYAWLIARDIIRENPAASVTLPRQPRPRPAVLTLDQAQALLDAAAASPYADLLPYIAVSLFAGLRPTEAMRLTTADIGEEYITLDAAQTKTAHARTVRIRPNLRAILDACALPAGPIIRHYPRRFRLHLTELSRSASVPWAQDILRHTFASYAYEFSRDAAATAYEMGHTGTDIFFRHYRGLVPPGTGERFFALLPSRIRQENK